MQAILKHKVLDESNLLPKFKGVEGCELWQEDSEVNVQLFGPPCIFRALLSVMFGMNKIWYNSRQLLNLKFKLMYTYFACILSAFWDEWHTGLTKYLKLHLKLLFLLPNDFNKVEWYFYLNIKWLLLSLMTLLVSLQNFGI